MESKLEMVFLRMFWEDIKKEHQHALVDKDKKLNKLKRENAELKEKGNKLKIGNNNKNGKIVRNPKKRRRTSMTSSIDENGQNSNFV